MVGKINMYEFGMGIIGINLYYGCDFMVLEVLIVWYNFDICKVCRILLLLIDMKGFFYIFILLFDSEFNFLDLNDFICGII